MLKLTILFLAVMVCVSGAARATAATTTTTTEVTAATAVAPPPPPLLPPQTVAAVNVKPPSFVRVAGGEFVDGDCRAIDRLSGYNSFMLVEAAANRCCGGRSAVDAQFDEAAAKGLTLVRFFAFAVLDSAALQKSPSGGGGAGQSSSSSYDDALLDGLDYVVAAAGLRGLKLLAVFANNWDYSSWSTGRPSSDSKCWYTNATASLGRGGLAAAATSCDDFWSNAAARGLYKKHLEFMTTRVNRYTGLKWRDDPTIFANELFNEPRCELLREEVCAPALQSFIEDASSALKEFDANHLVTVGEDGFFGKHSCLGDLANPVPSRGYKNLGPSGSGWPIQTGQDCVANHAPDSIDFIAIHLWPENWRRTDAGFLLPWLRAHAEAAGLLGKPVLLEEFGKAGVGSSGVNGNGNGNGGNNNNNGDARKKRRDNGKEVEQQRQQLWGDEETKLRHYRLVYRAVASDAGLRERIKGILFWRWGAVRTDGDLGDFDRASLVETDSPVFREVIEPFSREAAEREMASVKRRKKVVRGCKVDGRRLPFVVAVSAAGGGGGIAVPRAPGAPGIEAEEKIPLRPSTKVVSTASASDPTAAAAAVAGRKRVRLSRLSRRRLASSTTLTPPTPTPPPPPPTTKNNSNNNSNNNATTYLPPPAVLGPFWMGSGRKIPAESLDWVLVSGNDDGRRRRRGGGGDDDDDDAVVVEKMSGGAGGAGGEGAVAEIASAPSPVPAAPFPRQKIDAREINALISCANLQL